MKKLTPLLAASISLMMLFSIRADAVEEAKPKKRMLTAAYVAEELTKHEWTLREIVKMKNDTASNLTVLMMPCEKDNLLEYHENGTYQITEGEKLCKVSDNRIKGEGEWEFEEADQSIMDRYNGGRWINKKVLELTPGMLKVQYESEGNTMTTLTYFSEIGQKDETLLDLIEDNSDHVKNIGLIPREIMQEARRYVVIGRADFEREQPIEVDDKNGLMKKVLIYPFMDSTNPNVTAKESERNKSLMNRAQKSGIHYIVTGNIFKASSEIGPDHEHKGTIKYSVSILDVERGEECAQQSFEYSRLEAEEKERKSAKTLGTLLGIFGGYPFGYYNYYGYGSWRYHRWNYYYDYYFEEQARRQYYADLGIAFTDLEGNERNNQYQSSLAVMDAIANTSQELGEFILESIPITIPINSVLTNKRGKFDKLKIEAGHNISIKEGEKLKLVRISKTSLSNGQIVSDKEELAKLEVETINGVYLATCKISGFANKNEITEAFAAYPEEIFVQTMEIKAQK